MLSFISILLPVTTGWVHFKTLSREMKILLGLFSFYIPETLTNLAMINSGLNTAWLANIYDLIEYIVFASVFAMWCKNAKILQAIKISMVGYATVWVIAKLSFESLTLVDTFSAPLQGLLLAAIASSTLIGLLGEEGKPLLREARFWVSTGVILYGVGTAPLFALANKLLVHSLQDFERLWTINWVLIIVANILYSVAFLKATGKAIPVEAEGLV
jgi:hypothetical protein